MTKMRAFQIKHANGPFELVERELPEPQAGHVRVKVQACGVCHSDSITKMGLFPGIEYPRVPGHEVAGTIDELGAGLGTAASTARVYRAGAEIFAIAGT